MIIVLTESKMETAIQIPTAEKIISSDDFREIFNCECASAFKRIYQLQQLKTKQLAEQVIGVKSSIWSAYGQQSYTKNRSLHIFALFSWVTQAPIETLCSSRRALSIAAKWQEVDRDILDTIVYSSTFNSNEFACFIRAIQRKVEDQGVVIDQAILDDLKKLADIGDDFLAPKQIDVETFKSDYYRSVALKIKELRENYNFTQEQIAEVMCESLKRFQAYEDPDNPISIPLYGVVRVLSVFKIQQTTDFVTNMQIYKGYPLARQVQNIRSDIILALTLPLPQPIKKQVHGFVRELFQFYKR